MSNFNNRSVAKSAERVLRADAEDRLQRKLDQVFVVLEGAEKDADERHLALLGAAFDGFGLITKSKAAHVGVRSLEDHILRLDGLLSQIS